MCFHLLFWTLLQAVVSVHGFSSPSLKSEGLILKVTYLVEPQERTKNSSKDLYKSGMISHDELQASLADREGFLYINLGEGWAVFDEQKRGGSIELCFHGIKDGGVYVILKKNLEHESPQATFLPYFSYEKVNQTKEILGFPCEKAVLKGNEGRVSAMAWFTPDIPVCYGPRNSGGLEGLILEEENPFYHFRAISIEQVKEIPFPKPKDFQVIEMPFPSTRH